MNNSVGDAVVIANTNIDGDGHLETRDGNGGASWVSSSLNGSTLDVIQTRGITVVNENGRPVVSLGNDDSGNGTLVVSSDGGEPALSLLTTDSGGALAVHSASGNVVAGLGANTAGSAALGIFSPHGGRLVTAEGTPDGNGLLVVTDDDGQKVSMERGFMALRNDDDQVVLSAAVAKRLGSSQGIRSWAEGPRIPQVRIPLEMESW